MEAVLAVIVGLVVGTALAVMVALPLRRRRARNAEAQPLTQARRILLATPQQRHRAAWVAAAFASVSTLCMLAGAVPSAALFMFGTLLLGVQSMAGMAVERTSAP